MANEITKLDGDGGLRARMLFLYLNITPPTFPISGGAHTVVATPSSELPEMAKLILTAGEQAALDAGTAAFEIVNIDVPDNKTGEELLVDVRSQYIEKKIDFITRLNRSYKRAGQRFNEV